MGNLKQRLIKAGRDYNYAEGVKVLNASGSDIAADKIVYFAGHDGPYLKIALADAAQATTCSGRLMITKHAIPNNGYGVVLPWKLVTGVDTTGVSAAGAPLYLSDTPGAFSASVGTVDVYVGHALTDATDGAYLFCGEGANRKD
tara:strand:+ start:682 stop:1113 length:432 start_codon:yes stop_codon:yes gene_type:complete